MFGDISINANTIIAIIVIVVLLAVLVVFIKLIQFLNELIIGVKRSQKTLDHFDSVLIDVSNTLQSVDPVVGDLHDKYFKMNEILEKSVSLVSNYVSKALKKTDKESE